MKNTTLRKWLSVLALALVMAVLSLQFQSARAQYGFEPSPYAGISATMIERGGFLYIVQGNTLYKVRAGDLALAGRRELRPLSPLYATPQAVPTVTATYSATAAPTSTMAGQNGNQ